MTSSCRRPGCTKVAAVTIRYDPVSCQLWLDPISAADRSVQSLCLDHAERLSPPRGWIVVDRRGLQTTIVTTPPVTPTETPKRAGPRPVRRRWGSFEAPTLEFTSDASPTIEATVEVHVEPEPVALEPEPAWEPEPVVIEPEPEPVALEPEPEPEPVAVEPEPEPEPQPEPEPVKVLDDLGDLLKPRGGLLGRAFEATGEQRSALTLSDPAPSKDDRPED